MPVDPVLALLENLERSHLLEAEQLQEIRSGPTFPTPRALLVELVRRGWLTPFQVNQVSQGKIAGLVLGQYLLLERIGEGGMGQVFKARHRLMKRVVALKIIRPDHVANPAALHRFRQEIQAAARLSHPNIVLAHDADEVDGKHFLTMEYVEGTDLGKLVKQQGPLSAATACDYIRQAALGLQHAHEQGMVHRDIKPSNLLLVHAGGVVKLMDLGLARMRSEDAKELTRPGSILGTADYIAPEQANDSSRADIRADIYGLGCTLYFLLAGQPPFPGGTAMEKMFAHCQSEPEPLEGRRADLPAGLLPVLRRMTAKRPEDRYQTPLEVARALEPLCHLGQIQEAALLPSPAPVWAVVVEPTPESAATTPMIARPPSRLRWPWLLAATTVGILCLVPFSWLVLRSSGRNARITAAAKPASPEKVFTNSIGMKMVLVPAGKFTMGSPAAEILRRDDEGPEHEVTLTRPFYLGAHEVTVGQFRAFVQATGHRTEAESSGNGSYRWDRRKQDSVLDPICTWQNPGWAQKDSYPVVCVSWNDAVSFCKWLARKEGRDYRLPTEAEWEYACRADSPAAFAFGTTLSAEQANFDGGHPYGTALGPFLGRTREVGAYQANKFGFFDMHGNVAEWCADYYADRYPSGPAKDPKGPAKGEYRVFRGGAWGNSGSGCRSAERGRQAANYRRTGTGFRVASSVRP